MKKRKKNKSRNSCASCHARCATPSQVVQRYEKFDFSFFERIKNRLTTEPLEYFYQDLNRNESVPTRAEDKFIFVIAQEIAAVKEAILLLLNEPSQHHNTVKKKNGKKMVYERC